MARSDAGRGNFRGGARRSTWPWRDSSTRRAACATSWCRCSGAQAQPSGHVTRDAFERVSAMMVEASRHGRRTSTRSTSICTARWSRSTSTTPTASCCTASAASVGPRLPIVASLDFHANVSPRMAEEASALVSFRTYPHVDMAETGARAARCLHDLLGRPPPAHALEQIDFLMPLTSQSTLVEPMRSLMERGYGARARPAPGGRADAPASRRPTSPNADRRSMPAATRPRLRATQPARLADRVRDREREFALEIHTIDEAIAVARGMTSGTRPAADSRRYAGQPGRRGQRRYDASYRGAACGADRARAGRDHLRSSGRGSCARGRHRNDRRAQPRLAARAAGRRAPACRLSGRGTGRRPLHGHGTVLSAARVSSSVRWRCCACGEVRIAVASRKQQAADQAMFRHLGIEPADHAVLLLKSSVHFRADFGAMASRILVVEAPGSQRRRSRATAVPKAAARTAAEPSGSGA